MQVINVLNTKVNSLNLQICIKKLYYATADILKLHFSKGRLTLAKQKQKNKKNS